MITPVEAAQLRECVDAWKKAAPGRDEEATALLRVIARQKTGTLITAADVRDAMVERKLDTTGVDFQKVADAQNDDERHLDDWQAPRILPKDWTEIPGQRDDAGGAKYRNVTRNLAAILTCGIEADRRPWLHLSVSHRDRIPTWGEMRTTKEVFLGDREAYIVLPPKARYVNIHPHVLHMFALLDENAPCALPDFTGGTGSL